MLSKIVHFLVLAQVALVSVLLVFRTKVKTVTFSCIPKVIKKQILVTTLFLKGKREAVFRDISLGEFNEVMPIANDHKALENITVLTYNQQWYDFEFKTIMGKHKCGLGDHPDPELVMQMSKEIVNAVPCWLNYGYKDMLQDVSSLLMKVPVTTCET